MKQIPLTKGQFALVDDEDFDQVNQFKWSVLKKRNTFTAVRYGEERKFYYLSRFLLNVTDKNIIVDHINHNGLDNRRCNLRLCTNQQNLFNMTKGKRTNSVYKGVTWKKDRNKWYSRVMFNYKEYGLGHYLTEIEAAKAYDKKAIELFGEFANLNFK